MRFAFNAEISPPSWLSPALHTTLTGSGLVYLQGPSISAMLTAGVTFGLGLSYGLLLRARSSHAKPNARGKRR